MQSLLVWQWKKNPLTDSFEAKERPISLIIAARNEEKNLRFFLPLILAQTYSHFEVIVVLDRCEDGSESFVRGLGDKYAHLRILSIPEAVEGWSPKKYALTQAIHAAKHERLVFTDADCSPHPQWLGQVAAHFGEEVELVLGISPYFEEKSWLNRFIRFETFYTAAQYVGFARLGMPYMGVGRNIAYRKSFFQKQAGFENFRDKLSGDDDLFVNAFANAKSTICMTDERSFVYSEPKHDFKSWMRQKFRHVSASPHYSLKTKFFLALFHFSHLGLWILGITLLSIQYQVFWVFILLLLRLAASFFLWIPVMRKQKEQNLLRIFPFLDIIYLFYNLILVPIGLIRRPTWK